MTIQQINEIAAATRRCCRSGASGQRPNVISVWPDGSWSEGADTNTDVARKNGEEIESRVACFVSPITKAAIVMALEERGIAVEP